jgi:hypothetical protein
MSPSSLKSTLYTFALGSLILYTTTTAISGFEMPILWSHWLMAYGVFFIGQFLVPRLLKFFTIPKNLLTFWVLSAITSFASIYAMSLFLPGIMVGETVLDAASIGFVSINPYTLSADFTMIIAGVFAGLLSALFYWLRTE